MPSIMKIVIPALAAAGTAHAACSVSATTTIQNSGDASAMASCSTFSGSIAIATGTSEDISIGGVKTIKGNLVAEPNSALRRISAPELEQLDGDMDLNGLTILNGLDFPKLKKVKAIKWISLPNLNQIGFTSTVEEADSIGIENTGLTSLDGINIQKAKTIKVANNQYINEIKMQLGNVTTSLDFSDNNEEVIVELPNLIWAGNLTFRFCGSVSLNSLEKLNGSLGLYNNAFESFSAPNLTEIGGALALHNNEQLTNASFPLVTKVNDDLRFANNSKLAEVDGLGSLKSVGGAFDISGNMTEVKSDKLEQVKGAFNIQSSENITETCKPYDKLRDKKLIQGKFYCKGDLDSPSTEGSRSGSSGGSNEEGAASTLSAMNGALGLAALAAVLLL